MTAALATQLVVTTNDPLSQAALTELNSLWADIATYGTTLEGQTLTQIRAQLDQFQNQILGILQQNQRSPTPQQEATATADPSGGPETTTGPSEAQTPTISQDSTATSEPTGSDPATESATNTPQPEDSETRPLSPTTLPPPMRTPPQPMSQMRRPATTSHRRTLRHVN